jgi:hypothetical protein
MRQYILVLLAESELYASKRCAPSRQIIPVMASYGAEAEVTRLVMDPS